MSKTTCYSLIIALVTSVFSFSQDSTQNNNDEKINEIVPVELLFKKSEQHSYSISPDGKYFVEVLESNVQNNLAVIDIDNYTMYEKIPLGDDKVTDVYWLDSKRLLYESHGSIFAIDIDGQNKTVLVSFLAEDHSRNLSYIHKDIRYNNVVSLLPENKKQILVETFDYQGYSSISMINVFTAEKTKIFDGKKHKFNKIITDKSGGIKIGIKIKDTSYTYYIKDADNSWKPFEIKLNGNYYPVVSEAESYLKRNIEILGFDYDPNIVYLTTNIISDRSKLLAYDTNKEQVVKIIAEDINCDVDRSESYLSLLFDSSKRKLAGINYHCIIPKSELYIEEYKHVIDNLNSKFPGYIHKIKSVDKDVNRFVIYQWNDKKAGNVGIYNLSDNSYNIMFNKNPELDEYKLTSTRSITAVTRDDFKIPCYVNLPHNYSKDKKYPMVVIPHGGPWARDYWELDEFSQFFSTRGYITLRVNFRGSTGFGKKHLISGLESIDEIMIDDIADATNFVSNKVSVDKNKVYMFGHSYGGYATYISLAKYSNLFSAGVSLSAPTDLKAWMKMQKKEKDYFTYEFWTYALGTNDSKYLSKISPVNYAKHIHKPLLVFHGKKDKVVPLEHSQKMVNLLKKEKKDVKLEVLQREGHTISDGNSLSYILESALVFFQEAEAKLVHSNETNR